MSSNQGHGHGGGRGRDAGGSRPPKHTGGNDKGKRIASNEHKYCKKMRHWARECRKNKMDGQAHLAQSKEEPTEGH
jgi:hypothetical protein